MEYEIVEQNLNSLYLSILHRFTSNSDTSAQIHSEHWLHSKPYQTRLKLIRLSGKDNEFKVVATVYFDHAINLVTIAAHIFCGDANCEK